MTHVQVGNMSIGRSLDEPAAEPLATSPDKRWDHIAITATGRQKAAITANGFPELRVAILSGEGPNYIYRKARLVYWRKNPESLEPDIERFATQIVTELEATSL
jgi:hypothetical protein